MASYARPSDPEVLRRYAEEILGKPHNSEDFRAAFRLWLAYHYLTEQYDRQVCSRVIPGSLRRNGHDKAMPTNDRERGLVNAYAGLCRAAIWEMATVDGIPLEAMERGKAQAADWFEGPLVKRWVEDNQELIQKVAKRMRYHMNTGRAKGVRLGVPERTHDSPAPL